jgi:hypothetical protein
MNEIKNGDGIKLIFSGAIQKNDSRGAETIRAMSAPRENGSGLSGLID